MITHTRRTLLAGMLALALAPAAARALPAREPKAEIGFVEIGKDITLRRLIVRKVKPKGTVLLLHGFPETLYAWKDIALALGDDYEVHAFDWPGYGQSSRPPVDRFTYAPRDYARVLKAYIAKAGIERSSMIIYATDVGALPALLLALDEPRIAKSIIVGDFAPFDRPQYMYASLQSLKVKSSADQIRAHMNRTREEILANAFRRGLPKEAQFDVSAEFREDMARSWDQSGMSSADAFYHYYSHFTRDQNHLEANLARLRTPMNIVWGELDLYIDKAMGVEFARRTGAELTLLPGIGHYPHLQAPARTIDEIRAALK